MRYCKCGCGTQVKGTWVRGHHGRGIKRTPEQIEAIKKGITPEKKKQRALKMKKRWKEGAYEVMHGDTNPSKRPEVAYKIGDANRRRMVKDSTKEKIRNSRLGKPGPVVSEKTKKLHSKRMKLDNPMWRKEVLENHPILKSGRYFISKGEEIMAVLFDELGIAFQHQVQFKKEKGYYTVDFFFQEHNKVIEFDGHYSHKEFPEKDQIRDKYLFKRYKISTLRVEPPMINNTNRPELIKQIKEFLNET